MEILKRFSAAGIVPVVVLEHAKDAVPTARALRSGGVDVMEITFRTDAAEESIRLVAEQCPEVLVGAGTVITLAQCRRAVDAGAKFIVTPGFREEVVRWCTENGVAITPGCVTPTEIMAALEYGIQVVKFFPANIYGGLSAMKALAGPFGNVKFLPTGGINTANIGNTRQRPLSTPSAAAGSAPSRTSQPAILKKSPRSARRPGRRRSGSRSPMWASIAPMTPRRRRCARSWGGLSALYPGPETAPAFPRPPLR